MTYFDYILLGQLVNTGLSLIANKLKTLAKGVLIPLGLRAAASATDAAIHEKLFGSNRQPLNVVLHITTLITLIEEISDIMKKVS